MQQRWLINLILVVIIFVLGAVTLYTLEQEKKRAQLPELTGLTAERIQTITIDRSDKEFIKLVKDDKGHWQLTKPFTLPANYFRVEKLLKILSEHHYNLVEDQQLNLADLKLDPPLATLTFDQLKIALGDKSPLDDGQRYIQINPKVYLITDTLFYSVNDDAVEWVGLSLIGEQPKITELKLPNYHLIQKEQRWVVDTTLPTEEIDTGQDALNTLIGNWQDLQAFNVERYQSNSVAQGAIEITLAGETQPLHFDLISTAPHFVMARPDKGVQYQLPKTQVDRLLQLPTKNQEVTAAKPPAKTEKASSDSPSKTPTE
ncbi:MAG: DUF4340 domain-containing protein [Thioploca sp.]|nr:DUF4340 domain-containing protein [Thioploca sp.]